MGPALGTFSLAARAAAAGAVAVLEVFTAGVGAAEVVAAGGVGAGAIPGRGSLA